MMTSFQADRRGPRQWRRRREEFGQRRLLVLHSGFRHLGHHSRRPRDAGSVPDAAVHAAVARLADRSAHRRLAGRQGLLPGPLHRRHDRQPRSAYSTGHRHLHRRRRTPAQHAQQHLGRDTAVRRGLLDHVDDLLHRDPVESLGHTHLPIVGVEHSEGDVLDRAGLRALRHGHRVLDRPADHLAVLQQREVQRGVPLRAGALARRVGGGRLLPGRVGRAHGAAATVRARRLQLQAVPEQDDRLLRLEPLDEPDHRATAVYLAVSAFLSRRDQARRHDPVRVGIRQHPGRPVVLPQRLRPVRRVPGRDHPSARPGRRQRRRQGAAGSEDPCHVSTARFRSTTSRFAPPTESSSSSRSTCAWKSATRWW